jgi:adenylate cyclase
MAIIHLKLHCQQINCPFPSGTDSRPIAHFSSDTFSGSFFVLNAKKWGSPMSQERARRKLSGILSADAVGYSRLMQKDEESTIRALADSKELMANLIQQYRGRVVDAPGDNLLAEFGSVVDAAECALKIQQELKTKNEDLPQNRRMDFRIGVNLGDVVEEAGRIYGDGVNIAARLERLAAPGGICVSGIAFDQVKNKLKLGYEDLGAHSVKNIAEPVQVYKVLLEPEYAGKVIGEAKPESNKWRLAAFGALVLIILTAGILIVWNNYFRVQIQPASLDKMVQLLPDKPSIAVLAFGNLSGDPEQEYLSDGISEQVITALSKTPKLLVIARTSSFTYQKQEVQDGKT